MSCPDVEPRVALYAGGELDEASKRDVERHLAACADCRELLSALRGQREAMGQWRTAGPSQDALDEVRNGVLAAVARGDARPGVFDRIRLATSRPVVWRAVGLAAAALLVFALWSTVSQPQDVQSAQSVAPLSDRPDARAVAVPAPRAADVAPPPVAQRAEASGATPAPLSRAASAAAEPLATRPRPEAARVGTVDVSLASASRDVGGDGRTASAMSDAPPRPMRRIEIQTADPNIRIIWIVAEPGAEPGRSGVPSR